MYPRLLLARNLLRQDGVIFISIDDNEQANLKLLCDDIFGEENFRNLIAVRRGAKSVQAQFENIDKLGIAYEYVLLYSKSTNYRLNHFYFDLEEKKGGTWNNHWRGTKRPSMQYEILGYNIEHGQWRWTKERSLLAVKNYELLLSDLKHDNPTQQEIERWISQYGKVDLLRLSVNGKPEHYIPATDKKFGNNLWTDLQVGNSFSIKKFGIDCFDNPKNPELLKRIIKWIAHSPHGIIVDFFAGSGTTGDAVMQLTAEDRGNRKFIFCQIDEPVKKDKPGYKFCIDNNLPPAISSITIERLRRAGKKIAKGIAEQNDKTDMFEEHKKQIPDIGFKVFDSADAPKLKVDEKGQIEITKNNIDTLSPIYNMIFTVGLDEPTPVPEEVVKECMYKIGNNYYIINSNKIDTDDFSVAIKNGTVFIDGWTASLNATLQNYKEDVKIVF